MPDLTSQTGRVVFCRNRASGVELFRGYVEKGKQWVFGARLRRCSSKIIVLGHTDWVRVGRPRPTILAIDDDQQFLDAMKTLLTDAGFNVLTSSSGPKGLDTLNYAARDIKVVLLDYHMPKFNGAETLDPAACPQGQRQSQGPSHNRGQHQRFATELPRVHGLVHPKTLPHLTAYRGIA